MEDPIGLIAVFGTFSLPAFIVWQILKHKRWKMQYERDGQKIKQDLGEDNSLSMRELNGMIKNAVTEATQPLHERIAELEVTQSHIATRIDSTLLDGDAYNNSEASKSVGKAKTN